MKLIKWFGLCIVIFGLCSWNLSQSTELEKNLELFGSVIRTIEDYYIEDIDPNLLVLNAIDYTVDSLDPFSHFYDAAETKEREDYGWSGILYAGIGINMDIYQGVVTIIGVREGYGAHKNGLRVGDQILKVDGESTDGLSPFEVASLIKGNEGDTVELTLKRGEKTFAENIVKRFIEDKAIPYYELFDSTGYIKFNHFLRGSTDDLREAILALKKKEAKQLILDLRGNYGGLINEAVDASSLFLEIGSEVMSQKGKHKQNNYESGTELFPIARELPVLVLIDSLTMSAAEIFAGAMQDYDRMIVAGTVSAGKGIVQGTYYPGLQTSVYLTISAYYTPSGRTIQNLSYPSHYLGQSPVKRDTTEREYLTKNGRKVSSDGGIHPDVLIEWENNSPFNYYALNSPLTFDFLNDYANRTSQDELTLDFEFEEEEFEKIFNTLKENSDSIKLRLDQSVATLSADWIALGGDKDADGFVTIKNQIRELKKAGLDSAKSSIKVAMEREIVRRNYFERGFYRKRFVEDNKRYNFEQYFQQYNETLNGE